MSEMDFDVNIFNTTEPHTETLQTANFITCILLYYHRTHTLKLFKLQILLGVFYYSIFLK